MAALSPALLSVAAPLALVAAAAGAYLGRRQRRRARDRALATALAEAEQLRRAAEEDRHKWLRQTELDARAAAVASRAKLDPARAGDDERLERLRLPLIEREAALEVRSEASRRTAAALARREQQVRERERATAVARKDAQAHPDRVREALAAVSGTGAAEVRKRLVDEALDEARAWAAQHVRQASDGLGLPAAHTRQAKRLMGIAVGRYQGHYLIERHQSVVPLAARDGRVAVSEAQLAVIAESSSVRLTLSEGGDTVRLEGQDGVGREVARRCINRLIKRPVADLGEVARVADNQKQQLHKELIDLGRRAFALLQIPRAHPEIVELVGRLNYRTSFTQNQWKHAIEAAFLCGMLAEELSLDVKVARRAALMHDIGKALTHEIEGSHAVIGADYARRLGEEELVANAIGAHHTEEPFASSYAYLVAAADAMSGGRPGARRQTEDNFVAKVAELERICRSYPEVEEAFAVQGGREVRVYVKEQRVDDLGAVSLSRQLSERISDEMTFPGQIRVTVIREFRAEESAG